MRVKSIDCLGGFIHLLSNTIPNNYGVQLRGSWLTNEYHATPHQFGIVSFSDIDYVSEIPDQLTYERIKSVALKSASNIGLKIKGGVSLRCRKEMDSMWEFPGATKLSDDPIAQEQFICFWTMISAAEASLSYPADISVDAWNKYQLTKFFLRLWRILTVANGRQVNSWREALQFAERLLPHQVHQATIEMKTGSREIENVPFFINLHSRAIIECISFTATKGVNYRLLTDTIAQVVKKCAHERIKDCLKYKSLAEQFVLTSITQKAALTRLSTKVNS